MKSEQKSERLGWYFYDWANSAFPTTVITVFLGPYITSIAKAAANPAGAINLFGLEIAAGSFFPYLVSLSVLLQVLVLPVIGAITDYTNQKKIILGVTAYLGAFATLSFYFLDGTKLLFGGTMFIVANVAFGASIVVYNSILNDIAEISERDKVSSRGWAFGYLGGGLLLLLNLAFFSQAETLGISVGLAVRICLASAGVWWAVFTIIPLVKIRKYRSKITGMGDSAKVISRGFKQFRETFSSLRLYPKTLMFLAAFLLFNDGVQAVITLSAQFGQEELGLDMSFLTTVILIVQFVAFAGSLFFNYLSDKIGTKNALSLSLVIWIAAIVFAFGFLYGKTEFMILGVTIGFVLGGTQALSRSLFSKMIPKGKEAEFFSFYELSDRGTSWLAPMIFGLVFQMTGSYRYAILSLIIFFAAGLLLLFKTNVKMAIAESGNS